MNSIIMGALLSTSCNLVFNPSVSTTGSYCVSSSADFREIRYNEKIAICNRNVSAKTKDQVYKNYNVNLSDRILYTIDHKVPLFLGGSNDINNLWPQLKETSSAKLENLVYILLSKKKITAQEATDLVMSVKGK